MSTGLLSQADVSRLAPGRPIEDQMSVVQKIASHYVADGAHGFSSKESELANNIFHLLMQQAETQVRATMALHLSKTTKLPVELVRKMASDVAEVANPMLEQSPLLTEEELIAIVQASEDVAKLEAIARRDSLSENLSDALVETQITSVVQTVVLNEGAQIASHTFEKIADRHAEDMAVMGAMYQRASLPPDIVEKVMDRISGSMRAQLESQFGNLMDRQQLEKTIDQSLELTSLRMMGFHSEDPELLRVLDYLDGQNKMTPFAALSMGNLQLFEITLSRMVHMPLPQVQRQVAMPHGLDMLFERAQLPDFLLEATRLTVQVIRTLEYHGAAGLKRTVTSQELLSALQRAADQEGEVEGIEYMYALIQQSVRKQVQGGTF